MRRSALAIVLAGGLLLTGCANDQAPSETETGGHTAATAENSVDVNTADHFVPLAEMEVYDTPLQVGETLGVLIDLPDTVWKATIVDESVLAIVGDIAVTDEAGGSVLVFEGVAPGTTTVTFAEQTEGTSLEVDITVE